MKKKTVKKKKLSKDVNSIINWFDLINIYLVMSSIINEHILFPKSEHFHKLIIYLTSINFPKHKLNRLIKVINLKIKDKFINVINLKIINVVNLKI